MPQFASGVEKCRVGSPTQAVKLADADEGVLVGTRLFLLLHGYEVETAAGGVECLNKLRRQSNPVLVLNVELPWGGGDGVLALLGADPTLAHIPVILTTNGPVDRARALGTAAVCRVLPKPVGPDVLLDVIHDLRLRSRIEDTRKEEGWS